MNKIMTYHAKRDLNGASRQNNNQSVENASVAFVKGANERNELFKKKKIDKQSCTTNKCGRTKEMTK